MLCQIVSFFIVHTAPPTKSNIFSSSSEAWNTSDHYFDDVVLKEGKKWVCGLSDDVVSSASAPFSFLPWCLFSPLMAQCPSKRWYPRQLSIVCFLFLSFPLKKKIGWNHLLLFHLSVQDKGHACWEMYEWKIKSNLWIHGSEILVSTAFDASHSKIICWYADLPLHTSLQCTTICVAVLDHYLLNCFVVSRM